MQTIFAVVLPILSWEYHCVRELLHSLFLAGTLRNSKAKYMRRHKRTMSKKILSKTFGSPLQTAVWCSKFPAHLWHPIASIAMLQVVLYSTRSRPSQIWFQPLQDLLWQVLEMLGKRGKVCFYNFGPILLAIMCSCASFRVRIRWFSPSRTARSWRVCVQESPQSVGVYQHKALADSDQSGLGGESIWLEVLNGLQQY